MTQLAISDHDNTDHLSTLEHDAWLQTQEFEYRITAYTYRSCGSKPLEVFNLPIIDCGSKFEVNWPFATLSDAREHLEQCARAYFANRAGYSKAFMEIHHRGQLTLKNTVAYIVKA